VNAIVKEIILRARSRKRREGIAMFLAVIVVGFAMMTLGVALLLLGEVPFVSGKRIPAVRSRWIGAIFVGFLPLAFAVHTVNNALFGPEAVQGPVVVGVLFAACLWTAFAILFRVLVPKRDGRPAKGAADVLDKKNPFAQMPAEQVAEPMPAPEPAKKSERPKPAASKRRKPADDEADPFDFS
jgi:hypothetical protein